MQGWLINTLAVLVTVVILRGHIRYSQPMDVFIASLLLGVLNAFIRPFIMYMALPLLLFTLGLFMLVINAALLYLVDAIMGGRFQVDSFGWAVLGAAIISIVSVVLQILTGTSTTRITFQRGPRPPESGNRRDDGGNGPVIDV